MCATMRNGSVGSTWFASCRGRLAVSIAFSRLLERSVGSSGLGDRLKDALLGGRVRWS